MVGGPSKESDRSAPCRHQPVAHAVGAVVISTVLQHYQLRSTFRHRPAGWRVCRTRKCVPNCCAVPNRSKVSLSWSPTIPADDKENAPLIVSQIILDVLGELINFGLDKLLRRVVGEMDDIVAGVFDQILKGNHASVDTQFVQ